MIDLEGMLRALESQVAQIDCPACPGKMRIRVGDIRDGNQVDCDACGLSVPLAGHGSIDDALQPVKKDIAVAFKRAFRAIEDYTRPPGT